MFLLTSERGSGGQKELKRNYFCNMADTTYCCSPNTNYFQEHNLIFFSVKERMEGRRTGMMERQFEKAKRQKGRENIQVITRVIT
jgi:hypothetical protein